MKKADTVRQLKSQHQELQNTVHSLTEKQLTQEKVFDDWSVKDILAHITAWHRKANEELNDLAQGKEPWIVGVDRDRFNQEAVEKGKDSTWEKVLEDWEESLSALLQKIEIIPQEQWDAETSFHWPDGTPMTRESLFSYDYEGSNHEGGHLSQIKRRFALD